MEKGSAEWSYSVASSTAFTLADLLMQASAMWPTRLHLWQVEFLYLQLDRGCPSLPQLKQVEFCWLPEEGLAWFPGTLGGRLFPSLLKGLPVSETLCTSSALGSWGLSWATSFSAASWPWAICRARSKLTSSVSNRFWIALLRRPHTNRSRKASGKWVPKLHVEAKRWSWAANSATLVLSACTKVWKRYLSEITNLFGANCFFKMAVNSA